MQMQQASPVAINLRRFLFGLPELLLACRFLSEPGGAFLRFPAMRGERLLEAATSVAVGGKKGRVVRLVGVGMDATASVGAARKPLDRRAGKVARRVFDDGAGAGFR
jgi:hypothetical protein